MPDVRLPNTIAVCATQERWCAKCDNTKLARMHHCTVCGECVAVRDHHCQWTANCVGAHNHKAFLLFLSYDVVCLVVVLVLMMARVIEHGLWLDTQVNYANAKDYHEYATLLSSYVPMESSAHMALVMLNMVITLPVTVQIVVLWITQLRHVGRGITVNEEWEMEEVHHFDPADIAKQWPYDLGDWRRNLIAKMGSPIGWRWLFPI